MIPLSNKDVFARNLQRYMDSRGKSRRDVCEDLGFSYYTFSDWVNGKKYPRMDKVEMLAKYFGIKKSDLIEDVPTEQCFTADHRPLPAGLLPVEMRRVPILGPVAAGVPILTDPEYGEYAALPEEARHVDAALRVEGDSMTPRYLDGDLVLIRFQQDVDDGQIAAVCIDDSITLKHVYHLKSGVQLVSENAKYPPMLYTAENSDCIHVLGLAVGYLRWD